MNNIECYVVCDLLPLYIDKACSDQTAKLVEEHLQSCEDCKKCYEEMNSNLCSNLHTPEFESKKIFRHARKNILGIIITLAAMISCFVINAGGAWMGGVAGIGNFIVTILYVIFWSIFSFISRKYEPLAKTAFVISLISFISAMAGLIARLSVSGGFIVAALLSVFSSIPFYGFRLFMDWTGLYAVATVLSLCWLIYTCYIKRNLKRSLTHKQ